MRDGASWSGGGDLVRAEENGQAEIDDEPKVQQEQQARPRERAGRSDPPLSPGAAWKRRVGD